MAKKKIYEVNAVDNVFKNTKKNEVFNVSSTLTENVTINSGKGSDIVYLQGVSSLDDLTFKKDETSKDLLITKENGQTITVKNYFSNLAGSATKSSVKKIRLDIGTNEETGTAITKDYTILNESLINYDPVITKRSKKGLIKGTNFNDTIVGSTKADKIKGGKGDDIIYGGAGNDKLYGGAGADTFIFDTYSKENPVTGTTEYYGSGADKIYDATSVDTLQFTTSKVSDLTFTKSKKNLIIKYYDVDDENVKTTQNSVTLVNYYKQKAANRLTKIVALNQYGKLVEYNLNEVNSETFTDTNTEKPDDYAETITIGATEGETEKTLSNTTNRDQLVFEKSTFKNCNFYKKGNDLLIEYKDETVENGETGTVTVTDYFKEDGKTKIDAFVDMNGLTHSLTDANIQKETLTFSESSNENIFFGRENNDLVVVCLNEDPYKRAIYENNTITTIENYFIDESDTAVGSYTDKDGLSHNIEEVKTVARYDENFNKDNFSSTNELVFITNPKINYTYNVENSILMVNTTMQSLIDLFSINNSIVITNGNSAEFEESYAHDNTIYATSYQAHYNSHDNVIYGTDGNDYFSIYGSNDPSINSKFLGGSGNDTYGMCVSNLPWSSDLDIKDDILLKNTINDTSGNNDKILIVGRNKNLELKLFFHTDIDKNYGTDLIITGEDFSTLDTMPNYGIFVENYFTESGKIETIEWEYLQTWSSTQGITIYTKYLNETTFNTIANEVASWLTSDGRSYGSTQAVFDSGNSTDIQALLKVYSDNSASAWQ